MKVWLGRYDFVAFKGLTKNLAGYISVDQLNPRPAGVFVRTRLAEEGGGQILLPLPN